jgi:DNA-directed RNA polymerase subunit beta'
LAGLQKASSSFRKIKQIGIGLASPDAILAQSYGEVLKPETINYRSFKPEKDGLFCEKIFGPTRDWECHCGKYKRVRYKGIICDRCGVEITMKSVRRERMGHITLATPVVHIWYFRSLPSKIGYMLGMPIKALEKVIYYESYVVISPGPTELKERELISEDEYYNILSELPEGHEALEDDDPKKFVAEIGGEAIKHMLERVVPVSLSRQLREQVKTETSNQRITEALKRLKIIEAFIKSQEAVPNNPEWMVLDVIPVIPPELRPLVPLEGGRFATSDLNDLYRRVIIRNNRLKKLIEIRAPEIILRNEKRMLQEAVDSLFDNGRKATAVRSDGNRPLKSLSDMLKGKQGRFRQNLLGKRVDYSGRSVIVVGPDLKLHQCGLPKDMAVELFKPLIIRKLVERGLVKTVKSAKKMVDKKGREVWDILETITRDHTIMLNRAPTLHRLGIQAFVPVLVEGKALQIHPLICAAFNADFDGDQMAVHVPLSFEAQIETKILMLASNNILAPSNGRPITIPSQDIVLGCYYLTRPRPGVMGDGLRFASTTEAIAAYNNNRVALHAPVEVRIDGNIIKTSMGRIIFNEHVPQELHFVNELMKRKKLEELVSETYRVVGSQRTAVFLDDLKDLGFSYATAGGISVGLGDVLIPPEKEEMITRAATEVEKIQKNYERGILTDGERYNKIIDIWTVTTNQVSARLFRHLESSFEGFNPIFMMADSGARGSREQIRQLAGMRGLMAKPQKSMTGMTGEIIENPITANFREGLSVLEYFVSTHGARKGLADTALKTADAGYLTRRLVDVAQDVVVNEPDCGTILGIRISALKEGEETIEPLGDRILGRVAADDIYDPAQADRVIVAAGELINEASAAEISETSTEEVQIRSVLTCESKRGICAKCYGRNLATGNLVDAGEAVGVIAAQSIGEPGTQLTLRTFHIGGTAGHIAQESQVVAKADGKIKYTNIRVIERKDENGNEEIIAANRNGKIELINKAGNLVIRYDVSYGSHIKVKDGDKVKANDLVFEWDPHSAMILTDQSGTIKFQDIKENITVREETDEATGRKQHVIIETRNRTLTPHIQVIDANGKKVGNYIVPTRSRLMIQDGDAVKAGDVLVKIPRDMAKTRDITGGLPRVAELFEARRPKDPATVGEIDGTIKFGGISRGIRQIIITSPDGEQKEYSIPYGKHVLVHDGDYVTSGEQLCEGSVAPHDILLIKGPNAVQEYLVNEIQEVYRLQGVKINDKHIEIIVRQMLQRVKVDDSGDTVFLPGDQVDKIRFFAENQRLQDYVAVSKPNDSKFAEEEIVHKDEFQKVVDRLKKGDKKPPTGKKPVPATFQPLLLGITHASLSTESFISAASFQETTKVLTDAAVHGKVDTLEGLKENLIMGHLIPAGTGLKKYKTMLVESLQVEEEEEPTEDASSDEALVEAE